MYEAGFERRSVVFAFGFLIISFLYFVGLVIYRLYFSPLSKFPGPKLAAATYLYEGYYDVVKRGKYTFKIRDLHAKYGQPLQLFPATVAKAMTLTLILQDQSFELVPPRSISMTQTTMTPFIAGKANGKKVLTM